MENNKIEIGKGHVLKALQIKGFGYEEIKTMIATQKISKIGNSRN